MDRIFMILKKMALGLSRSYIHVYNNNNNNYNNNNNNNDFI